MKTNFTLAVWTLVLLVCGCGFIDRLKSGGKGDPVSNTEIGSTETPKPNVSASPLQSVERDLLSFAEGTIIVQPSYDSRSAPAFGPIALIDSTENINWVSDAEDVAEPFDFVLEMPVKTALTSLVFDNDTSGFGGLDSGVRDVTVEVSDLSAVSGFRQILVATLKKGENGQRFTVSDPIVGRWVRATFKNNFGGNYLSVAEMRGFGDAPATTLMTAIQGVYSTDGGDYHITQEGTSLAGCYEPKDVSTEPAIFNGGIDGNIAKISWSEMPRNGQKVDKRSFLMVFSTDAAKFFTATMSESGVESYVEVKRKGSTPGKCAERNTAKDQIGDELKKDGRARMYGINFDFNSDVIRPESNAVLEQIIAVLNENADWKLSIEGHTDNVGGEAFNQVLSEKRAKAVKEYLVKAGIATSRLQGVGKGLVEPVATNENQIGRAQNRRVELVKL
ncbi:MAG TPA: OmpA family protein [Pyrinomonadaceae bacterium]|nr:OmpA family protein [Pyrinomonadaceae bacterium]